MMAANIRSALFRSLIMAPAISLLKLTAWVLLILLAIFFLLVGTEAGSSFLASQLRQQSNSQLHYINSTGSLLGGQTLSALRWHTEGARIEADQATIKLSLLPPKLELKANDSQVTRVPNRQTKKNSDEKGQSVMLPRIYTPLPLSAELEIGRLRLVDFGAKPIDLTLGSSKLSLDGSELVAENWTLKHTVGDAQFSGQIILADRFHSQGELVLNWQTRTKEAQQITLLFDGPLSQLNTQLRSQGPNKLAANATLNLRAKPFSWNGEVSALDFDLSALIKSPPLRFIGSASSSGEIGNADITAALTMQQPRKEEPTYEYVVPETQVRWENQTLSSQQITVESPFAKLKGSAEFSFSDGFPVQVDAQGEITPPGLYPQPVRAQARGDLKQIKVQAAFTGAPAGDAEVSGVFLLLGRDKPRWEATLNSKQLALHKLIKQMPELYASANLKSEGWVENASLSGSLQSQAQGAKHQIEDFTINWSPQRFELKPTPLNSSFVDQPTEVSILFEAGFDRPASIQVNAQGDNSRASVQGTVHPELALTWDADVPQLEAFLPLVSGQLTSAGQLRGNYQKEEYAIQGSWAGKDLRLGENQILALNASMALSNNLDATANISATAEKLQLAGWNARSIELDLDGSLAAHQLNIDLISTALNLQASASGSIIKQPKQALLESTWEGSIEKWFSIGESVPIATLNQPAKFSINTQQASLHHSCWDLGFSQLEPSTTCLHVNWDSAQALNWEITGELKQLPLHWLGARMPSGKVKGLANGEFAALFAWPVAEKVSNGGKPPGAIATARLELMPTTVERIIGGKPYVLGEFQTGTGEVLWDENELKLLIAFQANNQAWLRFEPSLSTGLSRGLYTLQHRADQLLTTNISGSAEWYTPELTLLPLILPQIERIEGSSEAQFNIAGTVAEPIFSGTVNANASRLTVPDIGLDLSQLNVELKPKQNGLDISANAVASLAQDNRLEASGQILWQPEMSGTLNISGQRFPLLQSPEVSVLGSPKLRLELNGKALQYGGEIFIDEAHIAPRVLEGVQKASSDQVFIEDQPEDSDQWSMQGEIDIRLGNKVTIEASGLSARLTGQLKVIEADGRRTRGEGEIQIAEGKFEAFGQRLRIDPGRIIFNNADITDPILDARAIRKLDKVTVGATVRGTVSAPKVELFSSPTLSQTDTLSYLVLGRPLQEESTDDVSEIDKALSALQLTGAEFLARNLREKLGIDLFKVEVDDGGRAALVMSKYLSPRFYVSYGLDAFDAKTRLLMRYTLSDSWRLEAESDGKTSSGDLKFTLERD